MPERRLAKTSAMPFPAEFRPVYRYLMRQFKRQDCEILDEELWRQSGVVYARVHQRKVVYIGSTDGSLSNRIARHIRGIATSMHGTAPRYRKWAEGKQITIAAYKPPPVKLLNRQMEVHRAIEAALIEEFQRVGEPDWFVARR